MTLVTAVIKPSMEGKVVRALHDLTEFPGFTVVEVRGQGRGRGAGGAYRATEYDFAYHRHLELRIVCRSEAAPEICSVIAGAAWTGHKGDGVIFTAPAQSFLRIRDVGQPAKQASP
jgi:nitrogen regulatory protein PII